MTLDTKALEAALLPCPFCGATPNRGLVKRKGWQDSEEYQNYKIWCPHHCASFDMPSEQMAIQEWNRRATPSRNDILEALSDLADCAAPFGIGNLGYDGHSEAKLTASILRARALLRALVKP